MRSRKSKGSASYRGTHRRFFLEKNLRCQLSSLAANGWIAEEPERWDRTSACKGALLQPLQSMFWSHHAHPDQRRHKPDRPWHRSLRPLLFSNNVTGSFMSPSNWSTGMKATRSSPLNWETSFTATAWSHQFFTDLGWWSVRGLNSRPPGQQTGALPTELTGRHWKFFLGPVYMELGDTISHFNLITLYMIGGVIRHMLPHLSTGHGALHLQVNRPLGYPEYSWISKNAF